MEISKVYFFLTCTFYFILFFSFNNKVFTLLFFIYLFVLYLFNHDFKKSLLFAYISSWPFNIGKIYTIELVPAWVLNLPYREYGITNNIIFTIKEIFSIVMALVLIREFLKKKKVFSFDSIGFLLLLYSLFLVIVSLLGSLRSDLSLIYALYSFKNLIFYWYVKYIIKTKKNILTPIMLIISAIILLETIMACGQFISRSPLGSALEESQDFLPIDISIEGGILDFRPVGTFSHANWLANFLLPYLFVFLPVIFFKFKKIDWLARLSLLAASLTFLLTLGRSAWISFIICFFTFLFIVEKKWHFKLRIRKIFLKLFYLALPLILPLIIFFIIPRLTNTFYALQVYGGGYTRLELIEETWEIIKQFPLTGVGLGMDVFYSYQKNLQVSKVGNVFSYFPESVHNGYLHLIIQAGIFPFLTFLLTTIVLFKNLFERIKTEVNVGVKILTLSLVLGIISLYINSLLQPFLPNMSTLILLIMLYNSRSLKHLI